MISNLLATAAGLFAAKILPRPSTWARDNLILPAPFDTNGPRIDYDLGPFVVEPIDWYADRGEKEMALCFGSQAGKTLILTAGRAWVMLCQPCVFGVMWPVSAKVEEYCDTRWRPMCEQSPVMDGIRDKSKGGWKILAQKFKGAMALFYGSNSPSMLASTPMQWVEIDEGDKAADATKKEAAASELFPNRIKRAKGNTGIVRASTPSTVDGFIWKYFLRGDQRRWFVPCPCCAKEILFVYDVDQTQLPVIGCEASLVIPETCKVEGEWDMNLVRRDAHMKCPHCEGKIYDHQKRAMNRLGKWKATNPGSSKGRRSYHLSSLYVPGSKTSFGSIAVSFLEAKADGTLQDVVNSMLAEPFASQTGEVPFRPETDGMSKPLDLSWLQMTVDVQNDHEWALVCRVDMEGNMTAIHAEKTHGWHDVRALQLQYGIPDTCVWVDSGGNNQARVYAACMDYGKPISMLGRQLPVHFGWTPCRGEGRKYFINSDTKGRSLWHFIYVDPYAGHNMGIAGKIQVPLFEIATHGVKDTFDDLKNGRLKTVKFLVASDLKGNVSKPELWKHLEGEVKTLARTQNGMQFVWKLKSRKTPNHFLDCCVYHIAMQQYQKRLRQISSAPAQPANERRITVTR
jgi:phage terminase large subunit GpA-like protein